MNSPFSRFRHILMVLAAGLGLAASAAGQLTLTAVSTSGSTVLQANDTFDVELTWAGDPPVGGTDYAVTLNTSELILTGRTFNGSFGSYADTPYIQVFPTTTNRVDVTWFKDTGFLGKDVTLHFKVPANYTGPGIVTIGLSVDGAQDIAATSVAVTTTGTTANVQQNYVDATTSDSGAGARTVNWTTGTPLLTWASTTPGIAGTPDRATINLTNSATSGDYFVDFNQNLTLNRITVNMSGTVNYKLGTNTRRTITWNARGADTATLEFIKIGANPLRNWITANSVLNTDLYVKLSHQGARDSNIGGIISGSGKLTVEYFNNVNSSTGTGGYCLIGTASDAASTHTGGTRLVMTAGTVTTSNFPFRAAKIDAFGSGALELNKVRLDLLTFNQTVGGLADGANGSSITDTSTATTNSSTTNLVLNFASAAGLQTYTGQINDGTIRKISLTKSGTGTQVFTTTQGYTGATLITGGVLQVNGSLAAGSAVTVQANGTLGGTGTVNGSISNSGTIAPGASVESLDAGAVTMQPGSKIEAEFANWTGSTPGTDWDLLNATSLAFAGTTGSPVTLKLVPLALANFSETQKTFTIATSVSNITGFATNTVIIDDSAMPGTGTWTAQVSASGKNLEVVYTPIPNAAPTFAGYAVSTPYQTAVSISLAKLMAKASDPDEDAVSITGVSATSVNGGSVSLGSSAILFTPASSFSGSDSFTITLTDARGASATGTVTVTVGANPNGGGSSTTNPPAVTMVEGKPNLRFRAIPGASYNLQRSTDDMATWQTVTTLVADSNGIINWNETASYPSAYYRFRQP
jgi:autotransporter-associated beta strand protein